MLRFILYVFSMKQENKYRIYTAPSICQRADTAHSKQAVWSSYNHESKGLKEEQMDLQELEYLFLKPAPLHCIAASKVSLRCRMFFLSVRGLWLIFASSRFRADPRLGRQIQEVRLTFVGVGAQ